MRVIVLGGTRFIGRAVVDALISAGHEPLVCHRGVTEPVGLPATTHLHSDRRQLARHRDDLAAFAPDALVDCLAMTATDARLALDATPDPGLHRVVPSSQDVYRAFATVQRTVRGTDAVPISEEAPIRPDRRPYARIARREDYSKLDVEEIMLAAGATVLRLPMTYGPHDYQHREDWVLSRVRAGRDRIPVGVANGLFPLALVDDVARGVVTAVENRASRGTIYNLAPARTDPVAVWMRRILSAAGSRAEPVRAPDGTPLPDDLRITEAVSQPLLISSAKARRDLGYVDTDPDVAIARSVRWHLEQPPHRDINDFSEDDRALAAAT